MKPQDAILQILIEEGMKKFHLARRIDLTPNAVWQRLHNQNDMGVDVFREMASALGYRLVLEPDVKNVVDSDGNIVRSRKKFEVG